MHHVAWHIRRGILALIVALVPQLATVGQANIGEFIPAECPVALSEDNGLKDVFDFGYITVPEQHSQPKGKTIRIGAARFRCTSDNRRADPLVLLTGGPGDSNLDQFIPMMAGPMGPMLLAERDIVIIELRGLRYAKPSLVCPEIYEVQLDMLGLNIRGDEANQRMLAGMQAAYKRFVAEGINLSAFNNVENAADVVMVMTTLGYDQFNLFCASAGTILAQHLMRDYPQRLRAVILNAAVPFGHPFLKNMMINASESLKKMFDQCEADEEARAAYPDLEARFFTHLDRLNIEPVSLQLKDPDSGEDVEFVLNGDRLSSWLFSTMYFNTQIPYTLHRFLNGDYAELQRSPTIFFPMRRFSYGISYCVFSTEYVDFTPEDTKVEGPYAPFANHTCMFFGPRLLAESQDIWQVKPLDKSLIKPVDSDVPTLILNGELDHCLPPNYVKSMASHLSNGHLYLFPGVAHSPIDAGACAFSMVMEFLADPSTAPNSECMSEFKHEIRLPE